MVSTGDRCCDPAMAVLAPGKTARQRPSPRHRSIPAEPRIPDAWKRYIVHQRHADYTPEEHDTWRRLQARCASLVHDLNPWLHRSYIAGFKQLVLPWSRIPRLRDVVAALTGFGWRAVCVDGYIPPEVYAGLMSRRVFPVSRNIRRPEHLDFSPTPDLAHDLLGHMPMFVCEDHRKFLKRLASAMAVARSNALDRELYRANRSMSALRCNPLCSVPRLRSAEARVRLVQRSLAHAPSALTQLGRMYLWSVEFGLMGNTHEFRIYGAGLLSSPAETRAVCEDQVPVHDFSLAVVSRDIVFSDHQTGYFVAASYAQLNDMLDELQKVLPSNLRRASIPPGVSRRGVGQRTGSG
jgi:phenylalanine-4-hydroxylase